MSSKMGERHENNLKNSMLHIRYVYWGDKQQPGEASLEEVIGHLTYKGGAVFIEDKEERCWSSEERD